MINTNENAVKICTEYEGAFQKPCITSLGRESYCGISELFENRSTCQYLGKEEACGLKKVHLCEYVNRLGEQK